MEIIVETKALDDMARHYKGAAPIIASELKKAITRLVILGQGEARKLAPVDTGRLKGSIAYEVLQTSGAITGRFGTNVTYAKPVEYGTGLFSTAPDSGGGRHWPPPSALDVWAARHGFTSGAEVAAIIGRRGGLKPRPYLRPAYAKIKPRVGEMIDRAATAALMRIAKGG